MRPRQPTESHFHYKVSLARGIHGSRTPVARTIRLVCRRSETIALKVPNSMPTDWLASLRSLLLFFYRHDEGLQLVIECFRLIHIGEMTRIFDQHFL